MNEWMNEWMNGSLFGKKHKNSSMYKTLKPKKDTGKT